MKYTGHPLTELFILDNKIYTHPLIELFILDNKINSHPFIELFILDILFSQRDCVRDFKFDPPCNDGSLSQ